MNFPDIKVKDFTLPMCKEYYREAVILKNYLCFLLTESFQHPSITFPACHIENGSLINSLNIGMVYELPDLYAALKKRHKTLASSSLSSFFEKLASGIYKGRKLCHFSLCIRIVLLIQFSSKLPLLI